MYWGLRPSWWKKPLEELPSDAATPAPRRSPSGRCFAPRSNTGDSVRVLRMDRRERSEDAALFHGARRPSARDPRVSGAIGADSILAATTFRTRRSSSARRIIGCGAFHEQHAGHSRLARRWHVDHGREPWRVAARGARRRLAGTDRLPPRMNKAGAGEDDPPRLVEPVA